MPEGTPKNLQITRRPSGLMVSLTFEIAKQPLPTSESSVGIDMGVVKRLTLSDGEPSNAELWTARGKSASGGLCVEAQR